MTPHQFREVLDIPHDKNLSPVQRIEMNLQDLLTPVLHHGKVRMGTPDRDGGYIVDPSLFTDRLVSVGCKNETEFEEEYLKVRPNAQVDIYDGGGECDLADTHDNVKFITKFIKSMDDLTLYDDCVVQMDIEGHELSVLYNRPDLSCISQFILEIHINYTGNYEAWRVALSHLNETHSLIHLHLNNWVKTSRFGVPDVLELTYVRQDLLDNPTIDNRPYPLDIDSRNCKHDEYDPILDWWIK